MRFPKCPTTNLTKGRSPARLRTSGVARYGTALMVAFVIFNPPLELSSEFSEGVVHFAARMEFLKARATWVAISHSPNPFR